MKYISIICFVLFCFTLLPAQKYSTGKIEMGCISTQAKPESDLDSEMVKMLEDRLNQMLNKTLYFTENFIALTETDAFGDSTRIVIDLKNHTSYMFDKIKDTPSFLREDIPKDMFESKVDSNLDIEYNPEESIVLEEKLFGLKCKSHTLITNGVKTDVITTTDIDVPDIYGMNQFGLDLGNILRLKIDMPIGVIVEYGITNFTSEIEDDIFSIDTTGLYNRMQIRNEIIELLEEKETENIGDFGKYERPKSKHSNIRHLARDGYIDTLDYAYKSIIEYNDEVDWPTLLMAAIDRDHRISNLGRDSLSIIMNMNYRDSPFVSKLLNSENTTWDSLPDRLKYKSVILAGIKDELPNLKSTIARNLINRNYCDRENEILNDPNNPKYEISDLIGTIKGFNQLSVTTLTTDEDIREHIENFYKKCHPDILITVQIDNENVIINESKYQYLIPLEEIKEVDESTSDYSTLPPSIEYKDSLFTTVNLYKALLPIAKQIDVNHDKENYFGIYILQPPLGDNFYYYEYEEIVKITPELDLEMNDLFLQVFPKSRYNSYEQPLGLSFDFHPEANHKQLHLDQLTTADNDALIKYSSTDSKLDFLSFLATNASELNIDKDHIDNLSHKLLNTTINSDKLIDYIPNIKVTVSGMSQISSDIAFKQDYTPPFSKVRNDFKDGYYSLYRLVKDDFMATDFRYNKEEHMIYFKYNGNEKKVKPGTEHMISFINSTITEKSDKRFFKVMSFGYMSDLEYYYLSPKMKKEIGKLLSINL